MKSVAGGVHGEYTEDKPNNGYRMWKCKNCGMHYKEVTVREWSADADFSISVDTNKKNGERQ